MAQPQDSTPEKLAGLSKDRAKALCLRCWQDGVVCDGEIGRIPTRWQIPDGGRWLLRQEVIPYGRVVNVKFSGTERVLMLVQGLEERTPDRFRLTKHARGNIEHGYPAGFRTAAFRRPAAQGGRLGARSPRHYPAWAECPKCGDMRLLDRRTLDVITLAEAQAAPPS